MVGLFRYLVMSRKLTDQSFEIGSVSEYMMQGSWTLKMTSESTEFRYPK